MTEPVILNFTKVHVKIKAKVLRKEYDRHRHIEYETYVELDRKRREIDVAISQLEHTRSVIDLIMMRFTPVCHPPCEYKEPQELEPTATQLQEILDSSLILA